MVKNNENIIESYVDELQRDLHEVKRMIKFLNIYNNKKLRKKINNTIDVIDNKITKIESSKSIDDLKKHVKLKKLLNNDD